VGFWFTGVVDVAHQAAPATASGSLAAFGAALIPIVFAYGGWQSVNYVAEEIKNPLRNLPLCLLIGTSVVALVYVTVNIAYLNALGHGGLAATTTPASDSARLLFGSAGDRFVTAAIAISTFGFLNLCVLAPTRVYYAMAADGAFFPQVARLHPKYKTPSLAIVLQSTWAIVLTLTGTYGTLLDYVVFADWIFFGLTVASVFVFRRTRADAPRPFRAWGYPVTPALFVIAAVAIVISVIRVSPVQSAIGAALMAAGVPAFYYWKRTSGSRLPAPDSRHDA
jgi:APA family basic amino acid/polyamine antiporter